MSHPSQSLLVRVLEVFIAITIGVIVFFIVQGSAPAHRDASTEKDLPTPIGISTTSPVVEIFVDYTCLHCQSFFKTTYPKIKEEYIDTGKIQVHFKDLPQTGDAKSYLLHQVPLCAREQGKYEEAISLMITDKNFGNEDVILSAVGKLVGDEDELLSCVRERRHDYALITGRREAKAHAIDATPAFVLGSKTIQGNIEYEVLKRAIETYIANL